MEELLAPECVSTDGRLTIGGGEPFGEPPRRSLLGFRMLRRVEQNHIVAVQQQGIALDHKGEGAFVVEAEPGATIAQRVGINRRCDIERGAHSAADIAIPGTPAACARIDLGGAPEPLFEGIGAALVAARDKRCSRRGDSGQSLYCILSAGNTRRISLRPNDDEVIPSDLLPVDAMACGYKLILSLGIVH